MAREFEPGRTHAGIAPNTLRPHPLANEHVPVLGSDQYARLKRSIRRFGMRHPITVVENGTVIDGHHRLRIALELGLKTVEVNCIAPPASAQAEMIDLALQHRSMGESQRAALALKQQELEAQAKRSTDGNDHENVTNATDINVPQPENKNRAAADNAGVSESTIKAVRSVRSKAPDLAPALESGKMTAYGAKKVIVEREKAAAAPAIASDATDGNYNAFERRLLASGGIPEALSEYAALSEHGDAGDAADAITRNYKRLTNIFCTLTGMQKSDITLQQLQTAIGGVLHEMPWDACICQRPNAPETVLDGMCLACGNRYWLTKRQLAEARKKSPMEWVKTLSLTKSVRQHGNP